MSYDRAIGQLKKGPSRPTLYKIIMPGRFIGRETNDYLEYFCNATQVPSVRYESLNIEGQQFQGITRLQPARPIFTQPFEIDVIENSDFSVYEDFKTGWMDQTASNLDQTGQRNIRLKYFNNIIGDIELRKLEMPDSLGGNSGGELREVMTVKFLDAYIKSIGNLALQSSAANSLLTFKIEFNYRSFTTEFNG